MSRPLVVLLVAFGLSLALVLICERLARRFGVVARPTADRWHRQTVPLLGGVAIVVATIVPVLVAAGTAANFVALVLLAAGMAAIGLVDDVRHLSPQAKLLAQLLLGSVLLYMGFALRLTGLGLLDVFLTLFWIVGVTNAFNLLDNMDGLSGTIAIVTAAFRLVFFHWEGDSAGVLVATAFIGAVAGFLVRNLPPAKIFMGDAGSLFLGFFLAGLSLASSSYPYSRGVAAVLVIPVLLLSIPIFDTAFVTVTRILGGRRIDVGGRDHTSHRLVAIGLTERQTLMFLAGLSAAAGGVAALSYRAGLSYTVVLLALLIIGLVILGIYLSRVRVVHAVEDRTGGSVLSLIADFRYKRQVVTLLLDACLIPLAYYAAYVIRFEDAVAAFLPQLYSSLPIVLPLQLVAFAGFGLYRGIWQFTSISDLLRIGKATTVGTMLSVVVLVYTERFVGFSRTVFVLDWVLLLVLVCGTRLSFLFLAEVLRAKPISFGRVLIYGAGAGGELVARELLNNPALERIPIGFVDDDRGKHATRIHGLPVYGGSEQVEPLVREHGVTEVILSSAKIAGNGLDAVQDVCRRLQVPIRRAALRLE
jgi:UDP-GlcNAc:undecaprenyl-phosphate GlcNAc-1-phosphate transferase